MGYQWIWRQQKTWMFDIELLASQQERDLLYDLWKEPDDQANRNAYADYLSESGREGSAELVRSGEFTPGMERTQVYDGSSEQPSITSGNVVSGAIASGQINIRPPIIHSGSPSLRS